MLYNKLSCALLEDILLNGQFRYMAVIIFSGISLCWSQGIQSSFYMSFFLFFGYKKITCACILLILLFTLFFFVGIRWFHFYTSAYRTLHLRFGHDRTLSRS